MFHEKNNTRLETSDQNSFYLMDRPARISNKTFIPLCLNNNQLITAIFPFSFLREHHGSDIILVLSL